MLLRSYRLAENFGGRKLWQIASYTVFGKENFGKFKLGFSDITGNWQIKLWQIRSKLPNLPKFPPLKFSTIWYHSYILRNYAMGEEFIIKMR